MCSHQHSGTAPLRTTARSPKMATVTFTATAPNGDTFTRTTGSMAYTHVLMTGNEDGTSWGPYSWHKSAAAAAKAGSGKTGAYFAEHGYRAEVVPAVPTSVQGVVEVGDFSADDGWQEEAINALIEAKNAPKAKKGKHVKANVTVYDNAADAVADILAEFPEVAADPEPQPVEAADPEGELEEALADLDTTEVEPEADATIEQVEAEVADADKVAVRKARRAARRAAKRANETADAKAERLAKRRERRAVRKAAAKDEA
ncbi:hypothetical protein ADAWI_98 [Mycobacterium phage Adawi]|uniref:Uncharacterized protein n=1 Tax=Mycobacterium phage Adawi TaxID=1354507 RepID=T2A9C8_9CAUD|nr:hypothetical protein ADAWI_98 [Mycobacterium phage Adawi]AGU92009.1 hypothetical protein ADAWI_98 [Mycobacterium phage Adawi]